MYTTHRIRHDGHLKLRMFSRKAGWIGYCIAGFACVLRFGEAPA
jgi:hypothetical protein